MSRPVIAVVGSIESHRSHTTGPQSAEQAIEACKDLGRALARDYDLLIFTADQRFAECHVLDGFSQPQPERTARRQVIVSAPVDVAARVQLPADDTTALVRRPTADGDWSVGFYRALLEADAVLLIRGDHTTRIAGTIALAQRTPLLTLATFGGAARDVWNDLTATPNDATPTDIAAMADLWAPDSARRLVDILTSQLTRQAERQQAEIRRRSAATAAVARAIATITLIAAAALLPLTAFLVTLTSWKAVVTACGAATLAAITGALITESRSPTPRPTQATLEGLAAGILAALLYNTSQIASTPNYPTDQYTAPRLITFLLPIGLIAGLSFRTILTRAASTSVTDFTALRSGTSPREGADLSDPA